MKKIKSILEFAVLFLANAAMLWFFHSYLNLLLMVGMIVFFFYAFFSVHLVRRCISVQMEVPNDTMQRKTKIIVRIRVKNSSVLPLVRCRIKLLTGNVFLSDAQTNYVTVPICPRDTTVVEYPLVSDYVGNIEITAQCLEFTDLLSFHTLKKEINIKKNIYILPDSNEVDSFSLNDYQKGMEEAQESKLKGSDFSDVSQVREYVPGDPMKNIHWKLSAKKDLLMVKERLQMSSKQLLTVLSVEQDNPEGADHAVELAYRLGAFFIRNRVPVTLYYWSRRTSEIKEEKAESEQELMTVFIHLLYNQAGAGEVEQQFQTLCPGHGYILINKNGIKEVTA